MTRGRFEWLVGLVTFKGRMFFIKGLKLPTSRSLQDIFEAQAREQEEHEPVPSLKRQDALIGKSLNEVL